MGKSPRNRGGLTKAERCELVGCPLAGKGDPRCADCTGPITWPDGRGGKTGIGGRAHRQCTSCPMNGKSLPVCFCGCDGPVTEFATDGQSMVTLGGMADADRYLEGRQAYMERQTGRATSLPPETEHALLELIRAFMELRPVDVLVVHALLNSRTETDAARLLGVTKQAVNQTGRRIAARLPRLAEFVQPVAARAMAEAARARA